MTVPDEYFRADFWTSQGWMAPWLTTVDAAYWREMIPCIGENMFRREAGWQGFVVTGEGREHLRRQLCTRISQASDVFVPWLEQAIELKGLRILEIGCGSGSSTAGLAHGGAHISGVDIKGPALTVAEKRLSLLGLKAEFLHVSPTWLDSKVDPNGFAGPYDLVVCYAMLEHLQIRERLNLLSMIRDVMRRDGAMLTTFETPNRFATFDWHSTKLAFTEMLPDELVFDLIRLRSPQADHPAKGFEAFTPEAQMRLYRRGRGVSWHEFDMVFGMENLEVLLDGYSPKSQQKNYRANHAYESALEEVFAGLNPPVPRGFCRPSLELLLKLKA